MNEDKIEEAANKYVLDRIDKSYKSYSEHRQLSASTFSGEDVSEAFVEGANWALANQWHDASNDLPYKDKTLVDGHTTRDLLCISDKNEAYIDFMELLKFGGKWHWFRKNIHKCKYWMPIPRRN